ncbi:hypothetical protein [Nocardioides sp. cx-173]|uniref:hypothetical protein n=1 Tax=Nocardioides sp. cx-173 TaxID=2898796 RepID=UPI001E60ED02|nr:hypothetical protein [Nocardioides sp. cx-173]MCD4525965.1 hypothetical protein [Nocardioides sp. cx-173]UGB43662.1 hypothetical protein LQ940_09090 [Nocardioides sp. cx-173]
MTARGSRPTARLLHVELTVDDLVVPAGVGDEAALREAVETALREALEGRLSDGAAGMAETQMHPDVRVRLDEPLGTEAAGLGRQVAAEVTRVVLP